MATPEPLLELDHVVSGYGLSVVLREVSFSVHASEVIGMFGRNGMGKTTAMRTIMGLERARSGSIRFCGERIETLAPDAIARSGLALVPETRRIFGSLSVIENLEVAQKPPRHPGGHTWTVDEVIDLFPRLGERSRNMGNHLSGGEQQMLAIGRGLMANPALLLIDEAFEGLAPIVRSEIGAVLQQLVSTGQSIVLVDSEADRVAALADRILILELGRVAWEGSSDDFESSSAELKRAYLGV